MIKPTKGEVIMSEHLGLPWSHVVYAIDRALDAARKDALEEAAAWHEGRAAKYSCDGRVESELAEHHTHSAAAIRSLKEPTP